MHSWLEYFLIYISMDLLASRKKHMIFLLTFRLRKYASLSAHLWLALGALHVPPKPQMLRHISSYELSCNWSRRWILSREPKICYFASLIFVAHEFLRILKLVHVVLHEFFTIFVKVLEISEIPIKLYLLSSLPIKIFYCSCCSL